MGWEWWPRGCFLRSGIVPPPSQKDCFFIIFIGQVNLFGFFKLQKQPLHDTKPTAWKSSPSTTNTNHPCHQRWRWEVGLHLLLGAVPCFGCHHSGSFKKYNQTWKSIAFSTTTWGWQLPSCMDTWVLEWAGKEWYILGISSFGKNWISTWHFFPLSGGQQKMLGTFQVNYIQFFSGDRSV